MPNSYESAILENPQVPQKCIVHREKIEKLQHDFDLLSNNNIQKGNEVEKLCVKIEETIQKLNDLTLSITKMITMHDSRIQQIEKCADNASAQALLQNEKFISYTMQTGKNAEDVVAVHNQISLINNKFDHLEDLLSTRFEKIDKRISVIEVWRWVIVGGALIIIWILSQLPMYWDKIHQ